MHDCITILSKWKLSWVNIQNSPPKSQSRQTNIMLLARRTEQTEVLHKCLLFRPLLYCRDPKGVLDNPVFSLGWAESCVSNTDQSEGSFLTNVGIFKFPQTLYCHTTIIFLYASKTIWKLSDEKAQEMHHNMLLLALFHPLASLWQIRKEWPDLYSSSTLGDEKSYRGCERSSDRPTGKCHLQHISSLLL